MAVNPRTDPTTGVPLHLQVERDLQTRIEAGDWHPGDRIPTEDQLCELYKVSRITVRQALGRLVNRGLLVRERGRGTFVRNPALTVGARQVTSFTTELAGLGLRAGAKVLDVGLGPADAATATALQIAESDPVVMIRRLRTGDDQPIGVQTSHLPAARFPGLENLDIADRSLYEVLRTQYGVRATEAVETFTAAGIGRAEAELLEVRPRTCGFFVERITLDASGPFERVMSVMRGDRYRVRFALRNP